MHPVVNFLSTEQYFSYVLYFLDQNFIIFILLLLLGN